MKSDDFEFISALLKRRSGLLLSSDKIYLLESRLTPIAHRRGLETLEDLVAEIRTKGTEDLLMEVTEAMTTNESFFFRDNKPFELLKDYVLPQLLDSKESSKKLRIWCAAASTGQEPYSIAIILKEMEAKLSGWNIEIVGTDIAQKVLDKAETGLFSQFEVQRGLPIQMLIKYFNQVGEMWQISEEIRDMVSYRKFNLLDPFTILGTFDIIFCRNVLIYFDQQTKMEVLERMRKLLPDNGTLFLGAAETVLGITDKFKPVQGQRGLYSTADASAEVIDRLRA